MKKGLFVLLLFLGLPYVNYAQYEDDFSPFQSQDKGDAIDEERERQMNEYLYQLRLEQQKREAELERKVREAAAKAQSNSSSSNQSSRSSSSARQSTATQRKQEKKARREAEHQAWLAAKRAAQAEAAERARQERLRKEREERERRERLYQKTYAKELQNSASYYGDLHRKVDNKATVGFDNMINSQPVGTERMQSGYVPSSTPSAPAIASIIPKRSSGHTVSLALSGNERSSLNSDWNQALDDYFFSHQIKALPSPRRYDATWKELKSKWDGGQEAYMTYMMKFNNGGEMPTLMGVNNEGMYVFQSFEKNKLFVVSEDGSVLKIVEYEYHSISDENLIKKIREEGWGMNLIKTKDIEIKGGDASLYEEQMKDGKFLQKTLEDLDDEDLYKLLPEIRKKYELTLFDNSSKMSGEVYTVMQQNELAYGISTSSVMGAKVEATGGQKATAEAKGTASVANGLEGKLGANVTVLEGGTEGTAGMVVGVGNKYYLASAATGVSVGFGLGAGVSGGIKYGEEKFKAEGKVAIPGASVKIKLGGAFFKCLNCESEQDFE